MSGSSPPLPPRRNPDASDRSHGGYGSIGQDVFRGNPISQPEQMERSRGPPLRAYSDQQQQQQQPQQRLPNPYTSYRVEDMPSQGQYQQPHHAQAQLPIQPQQYPQPVSPPFPTPDSRPVMGGGPDFTSPKAQRKTKGHVASACVPCKRAHLRCDAQRPCSRCLSNGKEDTCIDVIHKKRGRPRLRDEREPRYEGMGGMGQSYPPPQSMGRPLSLYAPGAARLDTSFGGDLHRTSSLGGGRVLKSQPGGMYSAITPRYPEHPMAADPSMFSMPGPSIPRTLQPQEPICAFLNMEMHVAKASQGFGEMIGVQAVVSRKLVDIVSEGDREKVVRLQRQFDDERRSREPNYLPPIYPKYEDRVIQEVSFLADEVRTDREESITFHSPDGQQRTFRVRLGLAKKNSTYFIVVVVVPATPQVYQQPTQTIISSYARETYSRDSSNRDPQYGYQSQPMSQPMYQIPSSYMQNPPFDSRGDTYGRTPGGMVPAGSMQQYAPPPPPQRQDYMSVQNPYQTPRSELQQAPPPPQQAPLQRQRDLQLPPIRDHRSESSPVDVSRTRDDRGRFDIGGLISKPDPAGRGR